MSDARMSHLAAAAADADRAPFLFSEADLPAEVFARLQEREQKYDDWTAARLFSQKRQIYEVIVRMLGAGIAVRLISDICGVTEKSVVAVRESEPVAVTAFRERLGVRRRKMMGRVVDNMAAALELNDMELGAKIAKDLSIALNILDGQERLDSGAPTQIISVETPALEEYHRFVKALVIDATEVQPNTGLAGAVPALKGAANLAGGAGSVRPGADSLPLDSDPLSPTLDPDKP